MATRTGAQAVIDVLGGNYDTAKNPSVDGFIATASVMVDRVITCATRKGVTVSSAEAELIERWLAAHFYMASDKGYQSRSTQGASATFQGQTGMRLESTDYGQAAMNVDPSGCLENMNKRQVASAVWLGKPPSAQIPYDQRD